MSGAALLPFATWQNYYVIIGTAAATLTGLMFVAITLMAQLRVYPPSWSHMRVFNTSNVVHFGAALLSAPWPALWTAARPGWSGGGKLRPHRALGGASPSGGLSTGAL